MIDELVVEEKPPSPVFDEVEEMRKRSQAAAMQLFKQADADGSGTLDQEEIMELAKKLGHNLNRRQARAAMTQMDEDGDGSAFSTLSRQFPLEFLFISPRFSWIFGRYNMMHMFR